MGHEALRDDTECQNCGHTVAQKYCPNCGQKNTETRQSFAHLVGHFAEDLTHYDSGFWRTIKYLLFKPGFLTTEYLMGKRQLYVPPVKLYIFISFIAFLLPALIPNSDYVPVANENEKNNTNFNFDSPFHKESTEHDEINGVFGWLPSLSMSGKNNKILSPIPYTSIKQMDSLEALKPDSLKMNFIHYKAAKKLITLYEHNSSEQVYEKFMEAAPHNIPKTLFIYMPLFAFWIWIFHGKKRWYFFDHCIFTLHYFSFLLFTNSILITLTKIAKLFHPESYELLVVIFEILISIIIFGILIWQIYYFYRSHRKMYGEKWYINFMKSTALFIINMYLIVILLIFFSLYTYYNLH